MVSLTFSVSLEAVVDEATGLGFGLVVMVLFIEAVMEGEVMVEVMFGVVKMNVIRSFRVKVNNIM